MSAVSQSAVFASFCLILSPLLILAPKLVVPLLLGATLVTAALAWRRDRRLPWPDRRIGLCLAILFVWALVSCLWTIDRPEAVWLLLRLATLVFAALMLTALAAMLQEDDRRRLEKYILLGFGLAIAIVILERWLGQPIYTTLSRPDAKQSLLSAMNRGATALAILVWPVTGLLYRGRLGRWALLLPPALFVVLGFLESAAALLGLGAGVLLALVALLQRSLARQVLILLAVATVLLAPFVAPWFYEAGLHNADWLNDASRHRVQIWAFSAEKIAERPLFGWGFDAADDMPEAVTATPGLDARRLMPGHPHNALLQIWLELGAVGAAIALALLFLVIGRMERLPGIERAMAQAAFICSFAIALVSYGIWQHQWIGTLFAAAVVIILSRHTTDRAAEPSAPNRR